MAFQAAPTRRSLYTALVSSAATAAIAPGTGSLLVAYVQVTNGAAAPDTLCLNAPGGTALTLVASATRTGQWNGIYACIAPASVSGVYMHQTTGNAGGLYVEEWTGAASPLAYDTPATGVSSTAGLTASVAAISPLWPNSLLVGFTLGAASLTSPTWSGTPTLTSSLPTGNTVALTGYLVTSQASAQPQANWTTTSRAWSMAVVYFKPAVIVPKTITATANVSTTVPKPQSATASVSVIKTSPVQAATADIAPYGVTRTSNQAVTAGILATPTPTQAATASISITGDRAKRAIDATAAIDGPPWSPKIIMGTGNTLDQALGTSYLELSGDIDGGGPPYDGAYDTYTLVIDGGQAL